MSSERFGVGYAHPSQEMDNTVFPPAHSAYGLELMTATNVSTVNELEEATVTSPFKRPAWMTTTNKENGPYQVARTGLHGKLERSVL